MDYTFSELRSQIETKGQWVGSEYAEVIENSINEAYFEILAFADWPELTGVADVEVAIGEQQFALPQFMNTILQVKDVSWGRVIHIMPAAELAKRYAKIDTSVGLSAAGSIIDTRGVSAQPASASVMTCVSDNTGDLAETVRIVGYLSGVPVEAEVTLNGTSSVSTAQTFDDVSNVSKSAQTAGIVTITAGAVTLSEIAPRERVAFYRSIRLSRPLDAGKTFTITYLRKPRKLSDSNDIAILPEVGSLILDGAYYRVLEQQRDHSKANSVQSRFLRQLDNYRLRRVRDDTSWVFSPSQEWLQDRRGL